MRSLVDKYLKKKKKEAIESKLEEENKEAPAPAPAPAARRMMSLCSRGATTSSPTPAGCYNHERPAPKTSTASTRASFARSAKSAIFPNTHFTNHESLPSLADASAAFAVAYPPYGDTQQADRVREDEYAHLEDHACLDYTGLGLFSHAQLHSSSNSSSLFNISYRPTSLASQVQYGAADDSGVESAMRRRIMGFLNVSEDDYSMVCTANRTTAFRLLAETYPFRSGTRLLTVYDHESDAVSAMSDCAARRGAKPASASFSWPSLRIQSAKLKAALSRRRRGLLVFPLQSRMSGTRHPYFWMRMAQENGWHVLLDACALGAKDLDALGLSLIRPDFLICSFFKLVGEDPSGFAGLFVKKSSSAVLEASAASVGIVSLVPAGGADIDFSGTASSVEWDSTSSAPMPPSPVLLCDDGDEQFKRFEHGEASGQQRPAAAEDGKRGEAEEIRCRGLDHADALGLMRISCRLRCLSNWLVIALAKLRHPSSENGHALVRIYGPRVRFDRGPALAFNVFDWKGEKVEPVLVQKLADRSNISLGCGLLRNICFPEGYEEPRDAAAGISVVNASLGFLSNFGDAYRLWSFVAKFLDADFVEKERWRYVALNQKMVEV